MKLSLWNLNHLALIPQSSYWRPFFRLTNWIDGWLSKLSKPFSTWTVASKKLTSKSITEAESRILYPAVFLIYNWNLFWFSFNAFLLIRWNGFIWDCWLVCYRRVISFSFGKHWTLNYFVNYLEVDPINVYFLICKSKERRLDNSEWLKK